MALISSLEFLAVFEKHLKSPSSGVKLPDFHELELIVGCKLSVPLAISAPSNKEESQFHSIYDRDVGNCI